MPRPLGSKNKPKNKGAKMKKYSKKSNLDTRIKKAFDKFSKELNKILRELKK